MYILNLRSAAVCTDYAKVYTSLVSYTHRYMLVYWPLAKCFWACDSAVVESVHCWPRQRTASADFELLLLLCSRWRSGVTFSLVSHWPVTLSQEWICPCVDYNVISKSSTAHEKKPMEPVNKGLKDEKLNTNWTFWQRLISRIRESIEKVFWARVDKSIQPNEIKLMEELSDKAKHLVVYFWIVCCCHAGHSE